MDKIKHLKSIQESIEKIFSAESMEIKFDNTLFIKLEREKLFNVIEYLYNKENYKHLSMMSYVDWIEDDIIELDYILYSYITKTNIILIIELNRENPKFITLKNIFEQAETYEIEFNEMMGIYFEGNDRMGEDFLLEAWDNMPPMRRDFDTKAYCNDNFMYRPGRDDAINVREYIREKFKEGGGLDE